MIRNYTPSTRETVTYFQHTFSWEKQPDSGYSFNVDWQGNLLPDTPQKARENYALCRSLTQAGQVVDHGVEPYNETYRIPATGTCHCGHLLHLDGDTTCRCGRHYNSFGQELHSIHDSEPTDHYSNYDY